VRPHLPLLLTALLTLPALGAGCLGAATSPVEVEAYLPLNDAQPGRATQFAFFVHSTSVFKETFDISVSGLPNNWTFSPETANLTLNGGATTSLIVAITPAADAAYGPQNVEVRVGETRARITLNVKDLGTQPLRAGIGTQLHYVLWWDNGTLASTNDPAALERRLIGPPVLDDDNTTSWPPLKVYVGGQRGQDPPEPYSSTGYVPVIKGFDARLQHAGESQTGAGMIAGETLAVRVAPGDGYTNAGNEEHALYGDALNFLIRIVSVDELTPAPCTLPDVCPPT